MSDNTSRQHLMKKLLDRWENEGGRIYVEPKSDSPDKRASKDNVAQTSESLTAGRNRRDDETRT